MAFWSKVFVRLCPRSAEHVSDEDDELVIAAEPIPSPPKKRARPLAARAPPVKKKVSFGDEPKFERDIPLTERTHADRVPIDTLNRGTERYAAAPRAVIRDRNRQLHIEVAPQGRGKARLLQCAQLDRDVVCQRVAHHKRAMDVAIWEPELFWNGRFYKVLGL